MDTSDTKTNETLEKIVQGQERMTRSLENLNDQLRKNTINGTVGGATAGGLMALAVSLIKNMFHS